MAETALTAEHRDLTGKGPARRYRAAGRVPGVLYGHGVDPIPLTVSAQDLLHLFHNAGGTNVLVDLQIDGTPHLAIPREVQRDHIHSRFVHIDFLAVRRDEKITLSVEVHEVGEAPGIKAGGVVEHHLRELEVECLPTDVPDGIAADISSLELGDMLHVRDLVPPPGVEILTDAESAVISIITPAALRVEADLTLPGEEAPAPEPEAEEEAGAEAAAGAEGEAAEGEAAPEGAEEGGES
jgi:large subunit ribosomal protein L25